jgi:hypothetical protein
MVPIDLLDAGLPTTFNLLKKNAISAKRNKTSYARMYKVNKHPQFGPPGEPPHTENYLKAIKLKMSEKND